MSTLINNYVGTIQILFWACVNFTGLDDISNKYYEPLYSNKVITSPTKNVVANYNIASHTVKDHYDGNLVSSNLIEQYVSSCMYLL